MPFFQCSRVIAVVAGAALALLSVANNAARTADAADVGLANCTLPGSPARLVSRPKTHILSCADANAGIRNLVWHRWGEQIAYAEGDYFWNDCTPDCVHGHPHSLRGLIVAWDMRQSEVAGHYFYNRVFVLGPPHGNGFEQCADGSQRC